MTMTMNTKGFPLAMLSFSMLALFALAVIYGLMKSPAPEPAPIVPTVSPRFTVVYSQNIEYADLLILEDKETGIQYVSYKNALTPLKEVPKVDLGK